MFYTKSSAEGEDCGTQKFIISFNLIMSFVSTAVSLRPDVQGGILQAGVITFYTTYLTWSALSEADSTCMPPAFQQESGLDKAMAAILTFAAVAYVMPTVFAIALLCAESLLCYASLPSVRTVARLFVLRPPASSYALDVCEVMLVR